MEMTKIADGQTLKVRRIPNFRLRSSPQKLLAAALEEFSAVSFERARLERITGRLGLSKTALYMHFPSKRGLFDRVIDEFCLTGELDRQYPEESLKQMLKSDPGAKILRIVLREWAAIPGIGSQYLEAVATKLRSQLCILDAETARLLASKALAPVALGLLFPNVWLGSHGAVVA